MNDWRSYDDVAETYERVHAGHMGVIAADLVALADPPPGGRALDVGTGTGVAAEAARRVTEGLTVGVDRSTPMLLVGSRNRPEVRFVAADAVDLPFRGGAFDAVTANFVISHFTRYDTALFDMIRVLRPGGRLAASAWGPGVDLLQKTWRALVEEVAQQDLVRSVLGDAVPWEDRFSDRERLEETLLGAGLRHVRTEVREYRFRYTVDEYVAGRETSATGRFLREMLGPEGWETFGQRARRTFSDRFADPLNDFRDVLLAVATKPS